MKKLILLYLILIVGSGLLAQSPVQLSVDSLFSLAEQNSKTLDLSRYKINLASNNTAIEKQNAHLPELKTSFSYAYLSNAAVWDNHLNYESTVPMPHTSIDFSIDASYLVFDGNASKNKIMQAGLEEQIAQLDYQKDKEDIEFLLLAKYLDLAALSGQKQVVKENIALATRRLSEIDKLIGEGMLTHNDHIRSELLLTNLNEQFKDLTHQAAIVNHDLDIVIGLPVSTIIEVDSNFIQAAPKMDSLRRYQEDNSLRIPEIQAADVQTKIHQKQENITKASRLPKLSLYSGDALSRPFIYSIPPQDIYLHLFQVGFKINYDLGSLYNSKRKIRQAHMQTILSEKNKALLEQKATINIHTAYENLQKATDKYLSQKQSYRLAKDNYTVVEQKYLNKFAVITDMVDAADALLSAGINMHNAKISIIYQYYNLLKTAGLWEKASSKNLIKHR